MSNFEEARHHGYSAADFGADTEAGQKRIEALGCDRCKYVGCNYNACNKIFHESILYSKCPYFKQKEA